MKPFPNGTLVLVLVGSQTGEFGEIVEFETSSGTHVVEINGSAFHYYQDEIAPAVLVQLRGDGTDEEAAPGAAEVIPAFGMSSDDLAAYVSDFIDTSVARVVGVGNEQYSLGNHQKFETMDFKDLLVMTLEEIEDWAVYAAMAHIRVRRVLAAIGESL